MPLTRSSSDYFNDSLDDQLLHLDYNHLLTPPAAAATTITSLPSAASASNNRQQLRASPAASLSTDLPAPNAKEEDEGSVPEYNQGTQYEAIKFGELGRYMQNKKRKLNVQEQALRDNDEVSGRPQIFKGCTIHVNGYAAMPHSELRSLIVLHGGAYEAYLDHKRSITHIVATSLTPKKREEFRNYKVVKPTWITESVRVGRRLRWSEFGLMMDETRGVAEVGMGEAPVGSTTGQMTLGNMIMKPPPPPPPPAPKAGPGPQTLAARERTATPDSPDAAPTTVTADSLRKQCLLSDNAWIAQHTAISPDFLPNYFAQSRLHHISTWKSEHLKAMSALVQSKNAISDRGEKKRKAPLRGDEKDERVLMHVDFDCFFISAGLIGRPELRGKPVAVCHAKEAENREGSTSEIASCSYEARACGVKNGMSLGKARELCSDIQTMPYDFPLYESVSRKLYTIILAQSPDALEPISVDECLIEVSSLTQPTTALPPRTLAEHIRDEVRRETGCEVSIGIGHNPLLAKLATKKAKPAGSYHILPDQVQHHLSDLEIDALPGVGWKRQRECQEKFGTVLLKDLAALPLGRLQTEFGPNWGKTLHGYSRGVDTRELRTEVERKSVSADCNYGIRFSSGEEGQRQAETFVKQLGEEVARRLRELDLRGRNLTLKLMVRAPDASLETWKFLGHGVCDDFTKSMEVFASDGSGGGTDEGKVIGDAAWKMVKGLEKLPEELRGVGLQVMKLQKKGEGEKGQTKLGFKVAVQDGASVMGKQDRVEASTSMNIGDDGVALPVLSQFDRTAIERLDPASKAQVDKAIRSNARKPNKLPTPRPIIALPSESELDPEVFSALPKELQNELLASYARQKKETTPIPVVSHIGVHKSPSKPKITMMSYAQRVKPSRGKRKLHELEVGQTLLVKGTQGQMKAKEREIKANERQISEALPAPNKVTDAQLQALGIATTYFRALDGATSLQMDVLSAAHQKNPRALRDLREMEATSRGAKSKWLVGAPGNDGGRFVKEPFRFDVAPPPTIKKRSSTEEVCDLISQWVSHASDVNPELKDVERFREFLLACIDRKRGHGQDLTKAVDIVNWWDLSIEDDVQPAVKDRWREAVCEVKGKLNEVVLKDHGAVLFV